MRFKIIKRLKKQKNKWTLHWNHLKLNDVCWFSLCLMLLSSDMNFWSGLFCNCFVVLLFRKIFACLVAIHWRRWVCLVVLLHSSTARILWYFEVKLFCVYVLLYRFFFWPGFQKPRPGNLFQPLIVTYCSNKVIAPNTFKCI